MVLQEYLANFGRLRSMQELNYQRPVKYRDTVYLSKQYILGNIVIHFFKVQVKYT